MAEVTEEMELTSLPGVGPATRQKLNDAGIFTNIGAGLTVVRWSDVAWGDYDNDGDLDLVISGKSTGNVTQIYQNNGGVFTDIVAGLIGVYESDLAWGERARS